MRHGLQQRSGTVTLPGNATTVRVELFDYMTDGWVALDDVSLTGPTVTKYYYLGSQRVAMRQGGVLTYLHGDHLGSASLATDASGAKITDSDIRYYPYGVTRPGLAGTGLPTDRRFTGQREETSLGFYDYGARPYAPALGRFLQADTIVPDPGNPQSLNRYSYTLNNPLKYTDPSGHCVSLITAAVFGLGMAGLYAWNNQGNLNTGDALLAFGVGAAAGALIGTGIGVGAGASMLAGAGVGIAAGGGVNILTSKENFDAIDFVVDSAVGGLNGAVANVEPISQFGAGGTFARAAFSTIFESAGYASKELLHDNSPTVSGLSASALTGFSSSILADVGSTAWEGQLGHLLTGSTPRSGYQRLYLSEFEEFIDVLGEQAYVLGREVLGGLVGTATEKIFD